MSKALVANNASSLRVDIKLKEGSSELDLITVAISNRRIFQHCIRLSLKCESHGIALPKVYTLKRCYK